MTLTAHVLSFEVDVAMVFQELAVLPDLPLRPHPGRRRVDFLAPSRTQFELVAHPGGPSLVPEVVEEASHTAVMRKVATVL